MTGTRFGLETVREELRRSVGETSLRQVADEIPMSFSGLRSFLHGGNPQPATRDKLVSWYLRARVKRSGHLPAVDIDAAVSLLAEYIADDERASVRTRRLNDVIGRLTNTRRR